MIRKVVLEVERTYSLRSIVEDEERDGAEEKRAQDEDHGKEEMPLFDLEEFLRNKCDPIAFFDDLHLLLLIGNGSFC